MATNNFWFTDGFWRNQWGPLVGDGSTTGPFVAVAEPDNGPPRISLSLDIVGTSAYITRLDADGRERPVRRAEPADLVDGEWVGFDYEAPFGTAVTYLARVEGDVEATSNTVTLNVPDIWLRHPGVPDLSVRVDALAADSFASRVRASRKGILQPMGRDTPIVVSDGKRKAPATSMTVRTTTLEELDALIGVLADDAPLLLSVPPDRRWGVTHEYISVDDVDETRLIDIGDVEDRTVVLPYRVVDRPAGGLQAQWTVADVLLEFATVEDMLSTFDTNADLLANVREP